MDSHSSSDGQGRNGQGGGDAGEEGEKGKEERGILHGKEVIVEHYWSMAGINPSVYVEPVQGNQCR